jgi:hypothetical protein
MDQVPPAQILDFAAVTGEDAGEIDLSWTAPGDDSLSGIASEYIIKVYSEIINESNWDSASLIANPPTPVEPGSLQTFTITGLVPAQLYYIAVKTIDDYNNISELSIVDSANAKFGFIQDIDNNENSIPDVFSLEQNYPNPFNPSTIIKFSLPEPSNVKLDIYNSIGQKVITLIDKYMQPGFYLQQWNGEDVFGEPLASGIYFYIIQANQFVNTKKMILVK